MKVLFENEYARLWLDGHSPILYSKVIAIPQKMEELKRMCGVYADAIKSSLKSYKRIYSLSDFSEIRIVPGKDMIQFYANFLPNLKNSGIVFKAFIKPRGTSEQKLLSEVVNNSTSLQAASYDRFEEALSAINQLRQTEKSEEKSFLRAILTW
jgi:hypothetical protein